jgi:hypothetical protein
MKKVAFIFIMLLSYMGSQAQSLKFNVQEVYSKTLVLSAISGTVTTDYIISTGSFPLVGDSVNFIIQVSADTCANANCTSYSSYTWTEDSIVVNMFVQPLTADWLSDSTSSAVLGATSNAGSWVFCGQKNMERFAYFSNHILRPNSYQYGKFWFKITNHSVWQQRAKIKVWMIRKVIQ